MFSFLRRPSTRESTIEELDELRRDRGVRILDVRADWEFKRGHVPGGRPRPAQAAVRPRRHAAARRALRGHLPVRQSESERDELPHRSGIRRRGLGSRRHRGVGTQRQAAQVRPGDRPAA